MDRPEEKDRRIRLGAPLAGLHPLGPSKMRADVPVYINYDSFPPKVRPTIRDAKVKLNTLTDANGNLVSGGKLGAVLDLALRTLGEHVKVRPTPDFIEILWTGPPAGADAAWRPLRHPPKPRTEAMQWLNRGIEQVPESGRLYRARGQVHLEQYELEAAIADLTRAIERNPADRRAYRLRSLAYAARGNPGDAALARADAPAAKPEGARGAG